MKLRSKVPASRGLSVGLITALVVSMLSLLTSSATALDPKTTPPSEAPVKSPSVSAHLEDRGVDLRWHGVPSNAISFRVFRSAGDETEELTSKPISPRRFVDTSAVAGTKYTYSVQVAEIASSAKTKKAQTTRGTKASVGQTLGTVEFTTPADFSTTASAARKSTAKARAKHLSGLERRGNRVKKVAAPPSAERVSSVNSEAKSHVGSGCERQGGLPASETWSAALCPEGYLITGDVTVDAGETLTLTPGTEIYFSLFDGSSAVTDTAGLPNLNDLIVHGALSASGNLGAPVVMTSASLNPDVTQTALPADWGQILVDGSSSDLSFLDISYGSSIIFDGIAPAFTSSWITQMYGGNTYENSAVDYVDPPAGATINIDGLEVVTSESGYYGLSITSYDYGVNEFTANITNSYFEANYPVWLYDYSYDANSRVTANVTRNEIVENSSGDGLEIYAYEEDGASPKGTATINGTVADNTIRAADGTGIWAEAYSSDSGANHFVNYLDNTVDAYEYASENYAYSYGDDDALISYLVSGGSYTSQDYSAWYDEADADGAGDALAGPLFRSTLLKSPSGYALEVYSYTDTASARSVPDIRNSRLDAPDGSEGIYSYAAVDSSGNSSASAVSNPVVVDSTIVAKGGDGIYSEAYANEGSATSNPTLTRSLIDAYDDGIETYTYVSTGSGDSVSNPTITDSEIQAGLDSYGLYVYVQNNDDGDAVASPAVSNGRILGLDDDGVYIYVESNGDGAATSVPTFTNNTEIISYEDRAFEGDAYAYGSGGVVMSPVFTDSTLKGVDEGLDIEVYTYGAGDAVTAPTVTRSTIHSDEDEAMELYAYTGTSTGDARVLPNVSSSNITNTDDDYGFYGEASASSGDGEAQVGGSFTNSRIETGSDAIEFYAYGNDTNDSLVNTTFTNTPIFSADGYGVYGYVDNYYGGSARMVPTFTNSPIAAPDGTGVDLEAYGYNGLAGEVLEVAPTMTNSTITSGDDSLYLFAYDCCTSGAEDIHVGGSFSNMNLRSDWNYAAEASAYGYYTSGDVTVNPVFNNVTADSYDGLYTYAYNDGSGGDAINGTSVSHPGGGMWESWWGYGMDVEAQAYSGGDAINNAHVRGFNISAYYNNLYLYSYSGSGDGFLNATVENNLLDGAYDSGDYEAIYSLAYGSGTGNLGGHITGNTIRDKESDGLDSYVGGSSENIDHLIANNLFWNLGGDGIYFEASGTTDSTDIVEIASNKIRNTEEAGIYVYGPVIADIHNNEQSFSGIANYSSSTEDHAGIVVSNGPSSGIGTSSVDCNTITRNQNGLYYTGNDTDNDPETHFNNFVKGAAKNRPYNLVSDNDGTTDATQNWWGTTSLGAIGATVENTGTGTIDVNAPLGGAGCFPFPPGYWLTASDGGVFAFGGAPFHGSMGGRPLAAPVVGIDSTPTGNGYWLVAKDGGIFAFGDAGFFGSMGGRALAAPVTGMAATPTGQGYWLTAEDGGVFAFGDAAFLGSMGGRPLAAPVVGIASTPTGDGYWLVAKDGGIFAFGDAGFFGSMGGRPLAAPVVGLTSTPTGNGYWLVAADGGIFAFGDALFFGSMGGTPLAAPMVGIDRTGTGLGYWTAASDGGVFAFGDAPFLGSMGGRPLAAPVVGISATD